MSLAASFLQLSVSCVVIVVLTPTVMEEKLCWSCTFGGRLQAMDGCHAFPCLTKSGPQCSL